MPELNFGCPLDGTNRRHVHAEQPPDSPRPDAAEAPDKLIYHEAEVLPEENPTDQLRADDEAYREYKHAATPNELPSATGAEFPAPPADPASATHTDADVEVANEGVRAAYDYQELQTNTAPEQQKGDTDELSPSGATALKASFGEGADEELQGVGVSGHAGVVAAADRAGQRAEPDEVRTTPSRETAPPIKTGHEVEPPDPSRQDRLMGQILADATVSPPMHVALRHCELRVEEGTGDIRSRQASQTYSYLRTAEANEGELAQQPCKELELTPENSNKELAWQQKISSLQETAELLQTDAEHDDPYLADARGYVTRMARAYNADTHGYAVWKEYNLT